MFRPLAGNPFSTCPVYVEQFPMDSLPGVGKVWQVAMDAHPGMGKVWQFAMDAHPGVGKVWPITTDSCIRE
jgi:hypothetical protein